MPLPPLQHEASVLDKTFRATGPSSEVTEDGPVARNVLSRTEATCCNGRRDTSQYARLTSAFNHQVSTVHPRILSGYKSCPGTPPFSCAQMCFARFKFHRLQLINFKSTFSSVVQSSITDHIDPYGAKFCNSNLPYPLLMKLSEQNNSLVSCVLF